MHGNKPETGESFAQRMQQGKSKAFNHRRRFPETTDTSQAPNKPAPKNPDSAPPKKRGVSFQRKGAPATRPKDTDNDASNGAMGGVAC